MNNEKLLNEKELFQGLMNLLDPKNEGAFFKTDMDLGGVVYRIFNYRIPSWTQMQLPYAQECRGVMFDVTDKENPKLVCLAPKKFFNYNEGKPKQHEQYKFGVKMEKVDGSLMCSFLHKGKLYFKSKNSVDSMKSSQVKESLELIYANKPALEECLKLQNDGWTLNFEYISPKNRVVVLYDEAKLVLLSARSMKTGELLYADKLKEKLKEMNLKNLEDMMVSYTYATEEEQNQKYFLEKVSKEKNGEGYVVEVLAPEPYFVKVKNEAYHVVHHFFENLYSNNHLAKIILHEKADDAKSLIRTRYPKNPEIVERLEELEAKILPIYNSMQAEVADFYEKYKDVEMKKYVELALEDDKAKRFRIPLAPYKIQAAKGIHNVLLKKCLETPSKIFGFQADVPPPQKDENGYRQKSNQV